MDPATNPVPEEFHGGPSGNPECEPLEGLFLEFSPVLERLAWGILRDWPLASDAVQEAFSLLSQKAGEVRPADRRGWLVRTVQFQAKNLRRKYKKEEIGFSGKFLRDFPGDRLNAHPPPEKQLENRDSVERIEKLIQELPAEQRLVLLKRLREEKTFAEIATELELPLGTVLSRMRLALKRIRESFEDSET